MPRTHIFILLCILLTLAGCAGTSKQANAIADQNTYKPVEYLNAATPGPKVTVLPGDISAGHYAFSSMVNANSITDYAEIELSKANFTVLERSDQDEMLEELRLAANLGDAQALGLFRKGRFENAQWLVEFDVFKAEPVSSSYKGVDGAGAGVAVGVMLHLLGQKKLGNMAGLAVASYKSGESSEVWRLGLGYKIIDPFEGKTVASGQFEKEMDIRGEMQSFLGSTEVQKARPIFDAFIQRLVQDAVQDIDARYKTTLAESSSASARKTKKIGKKKKKELLKQYAQKIEEASIERDKEMALQMIKTFNYSYSTLDRSSIQACSCPVVHQIIADNSDLQKMFELTEKNPQWREIFCIDISDLRYTMQEYSPDSCKIHVSGNIDIVIKGKDKKTSVTDEDVEMIKENGTWKVCSLKITKVQ